MTQCHKTKWSDDMVERVTQQYRLYDAERTVDPGLPFVDLDDLRIWLFDDVIDKEWFTRRWPHVIGLDLTCNQRATASQCQLVDGVAMIEFAPNQLNKLIALHEMAHCCSTGPRAHDPIFARTYLELVYLALGTNRWMSLRQAFRDHDICYDERCLELPACCCS